jgi:hypothetical protein
MSVEQTLLEIEDSKRSFDIEKEDTTYKRDQKKDGIDKLGSRKYQES